MGELTFFLGLQVKQKKNGIFISQDKYVAEILKKFGLTEGKSASTPIDTEKPLLKDHDGEDVDVHIYRSMIGSLMYLTSSRPDIMFAVCACTRFQVTPKVSHLHAVKRIFRYLKGKPHLGLWYPKDSPFDLVAYSDSDYASASLDRKSTTGGCQFLGCRLIFWQCKKQTVVATSSTEVEYVAAASCCAQVLWIQNQMLDYGSILMLFKGIYLLDRIFGFGLTLQSKEVTRLQALVDRKKVVVIEVAIRDALRLDDAEGVDCLPNEEIFTELAPMGYEKPSTKLTFYKAFLSSQWKFLIHTILQSMSAKRTSWNEFSSAMTSAVICLSSEEQGTDDNAAEEPDTAVSEDDAENQSIPSPTPPIPPPQLPQDIPSTSQAQFPPPQPQVEHLEHDKVAQDLKIIKLKTKVKKLERANKGRMIDELDRDEGVVLMSEKEEKKAEEVKDITDEPEVHEAVEVVTTTKLITEVVAAVSETVIAVVVVPAATVTAAPVKVAIPSTRRRRRVVIKDPEEESSANTPTETKSKDKGKCIMDIDWEVAIDIVKQKDKENPYVQRYQVMKKRPQTEAQARRNMMMYLKNTIEKQENRAIESINETPAQKAAKRRRLIEEAEDVEELKQNLEIMPDKDDELYTEATPIARKSNVWKTRWTRSSMDESKKCPWSSKALELMLSWSLKKNTKCLLLLVKILVLQAKVDAAGYYCWDV
uniref:Uncharacterized mitochondrial protein AtMg00810-like n=1 Tax=Tanacetum cinerariifolium TaxID=118510 RepID=A0A6L2P3R7_TANCI|nr:uncharacterized mitochondrial protein AtMg00810-like [Tanacetum cinerariifolium]